MRYLFTIYLFGMLLGCGSSNETTKEVIPPPKVEVTPPIVIEEVVEEEPVLPEGAVVANFQEGVLPKFAYVKEVDKKYGKTTIGFEENKYPTIIIPETYGAKLSTLRFEEFDRDLLLVNARLDDPQFNKYYLYIFKDGTWRKVVKGFAIHKSHVNDTLIPITVDPENPNNMFRYYSVFDLDKESKLGYTWRLFNESVPILAK